MKPTEFHKINGLTETRYVLESASVGGTSSGSVASVSAPLGKIRKRDNILAQEEDTDPCWKNYRQLGTKKKKGKTVPNCVPVGETTDRNGISKRKETKFHTKLDKLVHDTFGKRKGEMEDRTHPDHEISMASSELTSSIEDALRILNIIRRYSEEHGLEAWQQSKITKATDYLNAVSNNLQGKEIFNNEDHSGFEKGWGAASYNTYTRSNHGRGVAESFDVCRVCGQTPCNCTSVTMESVPPGFPEDLMMKLKKQYKGSPERAFATAWSIHKKKKKSVSESSLAELQNEFEFVFNPKRMQLFVYPKGADTSTMDDVIAWIGLDYAGKTPDGEIMYASSDTLVQPKYHRRGIATAMYQYLRQHGVNIISSDEQTDKGAAMWQAFRKKGLAKDNKFLEDDYLKQLESNLAENLMLTNSIDTWKDTF